MSSDSTQRANCCQQIRTNPKFQLLVKERAQLAWSLTLLVLGLYFLYMIVVAAIPSVLHTPLQEGGHLTWGIPIAATIIVFSWLMTGLYVRRANTRFDQLSQSVLEETRV
ncbi:uncharacterized membrane protein (DUF485 family) [Azomonas agilis]|uniref:Uncharacterized membrane protein (DUF485 family) n=1 Tax=Azomonas agilis TaxID=116849 RepID=A0A562J2M1_9GAMM|nr:DUF485 domain-containing protein [Azomonas agilis]TWH77456.1 uncharacterized membrane protein (DUF485 family) [Azomonas agilis]